MSASASSGSRVISSITGWTCREHRMVFALVEGELKRVGKKLEGPSWEIITSRMNDWFEDKMVEKGERLHSLKSNVIRRSKVRRPFPPRNAKAIQSYITKTKSYGPRYDLLCRRILRGETVMIPGEQEDEDQRETTQYTVSGPGGDGEDKGDDEEVGSDGEEEGEEEGEED